MDHSVFRHASLRFVPRTPYFPFCLLIIRLPSSEGRGACVRRYTDGVCLQPISAQQQCAHDLKFM